MTLPATLPPPDERPLPSVAVVPDESETQVPRARATQFRRRHSPRLGKLLRRGSTWVAVVYLCLHLACILIAGAANAWLLGLGGPWGWVALPVTLFVIGSRFRAFGNMLHEASHYTLAREKVVNRVLGHLLAIIDFTSFDLYIQEHTSHHVHLGHRSKDLDFRTRQVFGFAEGGPRVAARHILRPLFLIHLPVYLRPLLFSRQDPLAVTFARLAFLGGVLALGQWVVGWTHLLLFYVLPYCTTYQILRYWSDAFDHAGLMGGPDELFRSRNHISRSRLLNWFFFPREDQFHLVHHLFPSVPTRHQGAVHQLLLQDEEYAALEHRFAGAFVSLPSEPRGAMIFPIGAVGDERRQNAPSPDPLLDRRSPPSV